MRYGAVLMKCEMEIHIMLSVNHKYKLIFLLTGESTAGARHDVITICCRC